MRRRPRFSCSSFGPHPRAGSPSASQPSARAASNAAHVVAVARSAWRARAPSPAARCVSQASAASWNVAADRARRHGLFGEQVRRAHQHADLRAAGQRAAPRGPPPSPPSARRGRRPRRARSPRRRVRACASSEREQPLDLLLPEHEARARTHVAAALAPLEDEAPRALLRGTDRAARARARAGRSGMPSGPRARAPGRADPRR
jgi:hypothetical protein